MQPGCQKPSFFNRSHQKHIFLYEISWLLSVGHQLKRQNQNQTKTKHPPQKATLQGKQTCLPGEGRAESQCQPQTRAWGHLLNESELVKPDACAFLLRSVLTPSAKMQRQKPFAPIPPLAPKVWKSGSHPHSPLGPLEGG